MKSCPWRVRTALVSAACTLIVPRAASAQTNGWQVDLAPLYAWAATTSGNIAVNGSRDVPVYLDFADAKDKLSGAFAFHGEAKKGRWGVLGDLLFIRLSSEVSYTAGSIGVPIDGALELDQTMFNAKALYRVRPDGPLYVVGGVRTVTMSPNATFTGPLGAQLGAIDLSRTSAAAVGGAIFRPKLGSRAVLLTQADIGGGSAFTWSALAGVEVIIKPWVGLSAGYTALGVDTGSVPTSGATPVKELEFSVTQYGPVFALTFHLGQR